MNDSLDASINQVKALIQGLSLTECGQLFKFFRLATDAPRIAKEQFRDPVDHRDLDARLSHLLRRTSNQDERLGFVGAHTYATIAYFLKNGNDQRFASAVRFLEQTEGNPHYILAKGLEWLGTSLLELCAEHRQLLTPDQLDYILFQRFAPASKSTTNMDYREKPALVVVTLPSPEFYRAMFFSSKPSSEKQEACRVLKVQYQINQANYRRSQDPVERRIRSTAQQLGIPEYGIVEVTTPRFEGYLYLRWAIEQAGRFAEQQGVSIPVGFKQVKLPNVEARPN